MSTGTPAPQQPTTALTPDAITSHPVFKALSPTDQAYVMRQIYNSAIRPTFAGKGGSPASKQSLIDWGIAQPGAQPGVMDALRGGASATASAFNQSTVGRLGNAALGRTPAPDPMVPSFTDAVRNVASGQNSSLGDLMFPAQSALAGRAPADASSVAGLAGAAGAVAGSLPDLAAFGAAGKVGGMAARGLGGGRLTSAALGNVGAGMAMGGAPDLAEGRSTTQTLDDTAMGGLMGLLPDAPAIEQSGRAAIRDGLTGLAMHMAKPYEFTNPAPITPDHTTTSLVPVGQVVPPAARRTIPMGDIDATMQANAARYQQQGGNVNGAYMMPPSPEAPGISSLGRPDSLSPHDQNVIANSFPAPGLAGRVGEAPGFGPRVEQPTPSAYQPYQAPPPVGPLPGHIQGAVDNAPGALDFTGRSDGFGPRADYRPTSAYKPYEPPAPPAPPAPLPGHLQGALNNAPGALDFSTHAEGFGPRAEYQPTSAYQAAPRHHAPVGPEPLPAHVQNAIDNALPAHELAHTIPEAGAHQQHPLLDWAARMREEGQRVITSERGKLHSGITAERIAAEAKVLAADIIEGGAKFGEWSRGMIAKHGEAITEHLRPIWEHATNLARNAAAMHADGAAAPLDLANEHTLQPQVDALQPKIARLENVLERAKADSNGPAIAHASGKLKELRQQDNALRTQIQAANEHARTVAEGMQADPHATHDGASHAGSINLDRIETSDDIKGLYQRVAKDFAPQMDHARRGKQSHEETGRLADDLGMTPQDLLKRRRGQALNAEEAVAARHIVATSAGELERQAKAIAAGDTSDEAVVKFTRQLALHAQLQAHVTGAASEAGRALSSYRIMAKESKARASELQKMLDSMGGGGKARELAEAIATLDNPKTLNKLARDSQRKSFGDMLSEYYMNSLLSIPNTHLAYTVGNLTGIVGKVADTATAAGIGAARQVLTGKRGEVSLGEARAQAFSILQGAREGLTLAAQSFKQGYSAFETHADQHGHAIPDWAGGQLWRLPSRLIITKDAAVKGIFYRMELNGLAYRQARGEGLTGAAFKAKLADLIANPTDGLMRQAREDAERQGYTNTLKGDDLLSRGARAILKAKADESAPLGGDEAGTLGGKALGAVKTANRMALNLLMPFVKLPANVVLGAIERSPAAFFTPEVYRSLAKGGADADLAMGRIALGTTIMASVYAASRSGIVTGGGPSDPVRRKLMQANGWQPYAIKLGDSYLAYNKLGTVGLLMGMAADLAEYDKWQDPRKPEGGATDLMAKCMGGIIKNLSDESWMKGVKSFIDAIDEPDKKLPHFLNSQAQGFVPFSGLSGRLASATDTVAGREFHSPLEAMQAKIPGLNQQLPARLGPTGEALPKDNPGIEGVLAPFPRTVDKHDPGLEELARLAHPGPAAEKTLSLGSDTKGHPIKVALDPGLQHAYMETVGATIKPFLAKLASSPAYQNIQDDDDKRAVWSQLFREASEAAREKFVAAHAPAIKALLADQQGQKALMRPALSYRDTPGSATGPAPQAQSLLTRPGSGSQATF